MSEESTGYFKYLLAMDCETTGLCFNKPTPFEDLDSGERHQAVSWGFVVADSQTLTPVKKHYVEIKWNKYSVEQRKIDPQFGAKAEQIHGLTKEYLDENGVDEQQAVVDIMNNVIAPYWGVGSDMAGVRTLGHNVHMFDLPFLRDLMERHQISLPFGNRHYDTNSAGFLTFGTWNSDELFNLVCKQDSRNTHNALDDAERALEAARVIRKIFQKALEE